MNLAQLAQGIRKFGLGMIGAICFMGFVFGVRENKPVIILAVVLVFSLTQVIMQEARNREESNKEEDPQ